MGNVQCARLLLSRLLDLLAQAGYSPQAQHRAVQVRQHPLHNRPSLQEE